MRFIDAHPFAPGTTVLVRSGLNVPLEKGEVRDDFRILRALPTLRFLHEQGAKTIVIAHIGRDTHESLESVAHALAQHLPVSFTTLDRIEPEKIQNGDIVLLENVRQHTGERENDNAFAQRLASLADIFVQDAFAVCHREHASIVGVPKYLESFGGLLLKEEIEALTRARNPKQPALAILGGAKFATKEPLIRTFLTAYDSVFVGGALFNDMLKARGFSVGISKIEDGHVPEDILNHPKLRSIEDVIVEHRDGSSENVSIGNVGPGDIIVDIGKASTEALIHDLREYRMILWNGPFGWYEKGYDASTVRLLRAMAEVPAERILGGGDTVAVVAREGLATQFDFLSTGGGAMLMFLERGTLPGIDALEQKAR